MARPEQSPIRIDEVDLNIVRLLHRNGRASYSSLAREVGLSHAAVRSRVIRLIETGSVRITTQVDPHVLGMATVTVALVTVDSSVRGVASHLASMDETSYVAITAGRYDLVAEIFCRDAPHLLEVLDSLRETVGIKAVEALSILHIEEFKGSTGHPE